MMYSTNLCFFGTEIEIHSENKVLIDRINYIFKYFISSGDNPTLFFNITIRQNVTVDTTLADDGLLTNRTAMISYSYNNIDYTKWKYSDTFLPPLQVPPFAGKFLVLHGCAIRIKNKTIAFVAPSLGGKTTLVYYSLKKGAKCITDDLIFLIKGNVVPYKKPVGIRETNRMALSDLPDSLRDSSLVLSNSIGNRTYLMHLDELFDTPYYAKTSKIDWFVIPNKDRVGDPYRISVYDMINILSKSICNSGLNDQNLLESLFLAISSCQGAFYLPTGNMELAYNNLLSMIGEKE